MNKHVRTFILSFMWCVAAMRVEAEEFIPPPTYSAEAIEAWVVDEDTGKPIEGAVVVAHWELMGGLHPDTIGQLMILEAVTDAQGRFQFQAWGPEPRPTEGFLHNYDPELLLFKSGYEYKNLSNRATSKVNVAPVRRSEWNKKTIKLKKVVNEKEYSLRDLEIRLSFAFDEKGICQWKKIPRMLVALDQHVSRSREAKGAPQDPKREHSYLLFLQGSGSADVQQCGSIVEFLRSYMP
ncbi:MAG: hypothetical protein FJ147_05105 [Deltaproteobacteria bacterium]|nr:hypothetical protein [Deltaproteobacteria bacterium]